MGALLLILTEPMNLGMVESAAIRHQDNAALLDFALFSVQNLPSLMPLVVVRLVMSLLPCPFVPSFLQDVDCALANAGPI